MIRREKQLMGGYVFGAARSGQTIMVALFLMVGSFYIGSLFGNNQPIYVSRPSSQPGPFPHSLSLSLLHSSFFKFFLCMRLDSCGTLRDLINFLSLVAN